MLTHHYLRLRESLLNLHRGQAGQGMTEYAFILILVAMVALVVVLVLGTQVKGQYSNVQNDYPR
ncbi:MAG: hypothetical protein LC749_00080 [Actinobacteria bacterium]|nr:hypothetical protein [Actinomycetota bacterium]